MSESDAGREAERVWWWAVQRTERDRRLALAKGRPITSPNLRRLLSRRLSGFAVDELKQLPFSSHFGSMGAGKGSELTVQEFHDQFKALTGNAPLSWQKRLFFEGLSKGADGIPSVIDLPTGLGKTMVMAIWLIARAKNLGVPTRLIYVVDRRTVVDQATDLARKLSANCKEALGIGPPAISTLRGQLADNREWSRDPSKPAIIIGTVDLIGSALLFSGYRSSYKRRPLQAGLLGQDSLLVLDEAHLSKPFEKLICAINETGKYQKDRQGKLHGKPMRVIRMSATSGETTESEIFRLDIDPNSKMFDLWSKIGEDGKEKNPIKIRFEATKTLSIVGSEKPIESIAAEAHRLAVDKPGSRIVIFVRTPKLVTDVRMALEKKNTDYATRVAQLTGTMRGLERDELVGTEKPLGENDHKRRVMQRFLKPDNDPSQGNCFLISTSAGEVGFDLNADHMVCDATTIESLIQRLGRVNRRGLGDAAVHLFVEAPKKEKDGQPKKLEGLDLAVFNTVTLLAGITDVSPKNIAALKASHEWKGKDEHGKSAYERACSPEPTMVELTDILLDAWSMTSIVERMPGRPDVAPWLRGIDDEQAQTSIAWRAELDLVRDCPDPAKALDKVFAKHTIRPHESLTVTTRYVLEFLKQIPKLKDRPHGIMNAQVAIRLPRGQVVLCTIQQLSDDPGILYAEPTLIFPAAFGGLSNGMLDAEAIIKVRKPDESEPGSLDVADEPDYESRPDAPARIRILIEKTSGGTWKPMSLDRSPAPVELELHDEYATTRQLFDAVRKSTHRMNLVQPLKSDEEGDDISALVCLRPAPKKKDKEDQSLADHVGEVETHATRIAKALELDGPIREALLYAAKWHDEGKKAGVWQTFANGPMPDGQPKGKMAQARDPKSLKHYRHEFGSLLRIHHPDRCEGIDCTLPSDKTTCDLALQLIATHHGGGRPHFPMARYDPFKDDERDALHTEAIRRFARLQRDYGWWHLAWLENLLRCADQLASADEEVTEIDELEEGEQ